MIIDSCNHAEVNSPFCQMCGIRLVCDGLADLKLTIQRRIESAKRDVSKRKKRASVPEAESWTKKQLATAEQRLVRYQEWMKALTELERKALQTQ
ncbi:MAG: hypothetical protein ABFD86_08785 [Bryobacteraceae bacterium]